MDQNKFGAIPYIPGIVSRYPEPLSSYLPQIPDGIISTWLDKNIPKGSFILDPFGASPRLAVEVARSGYRLLVTAHNPITRFLLEIESNPPKEDELKSALAELAASYKANDRMEPHIRSLYNTRCARCGQVISADTFFWEHGYPAPYIRIYTCPYCGDAGEHPCTAYDEEIASQFSSSGLHKARALERVVASSDQDRIHVEQALSVYTPRALYALITIINKIEGLNISSINQKYLAALLLHSFDHGNAMWRVTGSKERRHQLSIPRHFRENNIWLSLEQGIDLWCHKTDKLSELEVPVTFWPDVPPNSGGICIYEGRLVSIGDSIASLNIDAVCTALPRPNQAFWTLSALWAGWLWGREVVGTFKNVLHRQRYDWGWHTTALSTVFKQLTNILDPSTPILGVMSEAEPGFVASVLVAAGISGCGLKGIAIRPEEELAQIIWKAQEFPQATQNNQSLIDLGIQSAKQYLESRAEPTTYLNIISAAFLGIIQSQAIRREQVISEKRIFPDSQKKSDDSTSQNEPTPTTVYSMVYNSAREALSYRSGFLQYKLQELSTVESVSKNQAIQGILFSTDIDIKNMEDGETIDNDLSIQEPEISPEKERPTRSSDITESTILWLREPININQPSLTDRIEIALVDFLSNHSGVSFEEIEQALCEKFPGLYTPEPEFIDICLESYGQKSSIDNILWQLREEDMPNQRRIDLINAQSSICQIADRLGISCIEQTSDEMTISISWEDNYGNLDYSFFPSITTAIGKIVLFSKMPHGKGIIVLPASRSNLVIYKLQHDPRLSKAFNPSQGNWHFLKFRHLKSLAENPLLNRENLEQLFSLDPLTYSTPQLRLI
jgi:hypothetical protein